MKLLQIKDCDTEKIYNSLLVIDDDEILDRAINEAQEQVYIWLTESEETALLDDYMDCSCDTDFYMTALRKYNCLADAELCDVREVFI